MSIHLGEVRTIALDPRRPTPQLAVNDFSSQVERLVKLGATSPPESIIRSAVDATDIRETASILASVHREMLAETAEAQRWPGRLVEGLATRFRDYLTFLVAAAEAWPRQDFPVDLVVVPDGRGPDGVVGTTEVSVASDRSDFLVDPATLAAVGTILDGAASSSVVPGTRVAPV
ncbi:hypothetical protein [Branchiibius hedensis]|nr:hypothetical protein [Branchiibius hedensis]